MNKGYDIVTVRTTLLKGNVNPQEVDEAIDYIYKSNNQSSTTPGLEAQLKGYIKTLLLQGYTPQTVRDALAKQGFDSSLVERMIEQVQPQSLTVKHEIHFPNKTVFIIVLIILAAGGVGWFLLHANNTGGTYALLDVSMTGQGYKYNPGDTLTFDIALNNKGSGGKFDAILTYLVVDNSGNTITSKTETLAVDSIYQGAKSLALPKTMRPGTYHVNAIATYGANQEAKGSIEFIITGAGSVSGGAQSSQVQNTGEAGTPGDNSNPTGAQTAGQTPTYTIPEMNRTPTFGESLQSVRVRARTAPAEAAITCRSFNTEDQKDLCYSAVAEESNTHSYCENIINAGYRDGCYLYFTINGDLSVCPKFTDTNMQAYCRQLDLVNKMEEAYKNNQSDEVARLSSEFEPKIYNTNPQLPDYSAVYGEPSTIVVGS